MPDAWSPTGSAVREKVLEHIFLAELSKVLLRRFGCAFEVLRAEVDFSGYDLAIEANGVVRHIQLKAMRQGGKRAHVDVQQALSLKTGGCVVWMVVDPSSYELGPFLWFGGAPGQPMPPLGEISGRHSKADSAGVKAVRPGLRRIGRGRFSRLATIEQLAIQLFGLSPEEEQSLLQRHLADRTSRERVTPRSSEVLKAPKALCWNNSARFAHQIDGYELVAQAALGGLESLRQQFGSHGPIASATPLRLWTLLFLEHRQFRHEGRDPSPSERDRLDGLCIALSAALERSGALTGQAVKAPELA